MGDEYRVVMCLVDWPNANEVPYRGAAAIKWGAQFQYRASSRARWRDFPDVHGESASPDPLEALIMLGKAAEHERALRDAIVQTLNAGEKP